MNSLSPRRAAVALTLAVVVATVGAGTAVAAARAVATGSQGVTAVGSFGAQPQPTAGTVQSGPLQLVFPSVFNNGNGQADRGVQYAVVRSTGTMSLRAVTLTLRSTTVALTGSANVEVCRIAWVNAACPTASALPGTNYAANGTTAQLLVSASPTLHLKVTQGLRAVGFTLEIGATVNRAQALPTAPAVTSS